MNACLEADKIYSFIESEINYRLSGKLTWMRDTERFMFFSYFEAKALNKHSKSLNCWTIVIAFFTVILGLSTAWTIVDKYWL